jgi:P27 family predicted phage terminase small subunit
MPAGRPRIPTHLKILRGNRGHRPIDPDIEPQPEKKAPSCPKHVQGDKRKVWRWVSKELKAMGILTRVDGLMLEGLCSQIVTFRKAQSELDKPDSALLYKSPKSGWASPNPFIQIRDTAWRNIQSICTEYGMSAASRTRIRVEKPEEANPFDAYKKKKRA